MTRRPTLPKFSRPLPAILGRFASILFLTFACAAAPSRAAGPGTSAATFLRLGFGARPLGMGEAFVATADDAAALYYNPAGIALPSHSQSPHQKWEMLVAHSLHVQNINISQIGLVRRPFGFSLTYLSLNDIEGRNTETASPDNTFGASDMAMGFSYGKSWHNIGFGVTGKFIQQKIAAYSAETYAADIGTLYRMRRFPVSFGASLNNLGGGIRFADQTAPLPTTLRLGVMGGMTSKFPAALSFQLDFPRASDLAYRLGFEYAGFGPFSLRAGYMGTSPAEKSAVLGSALGSSASGLSELFGVFMGVGFRFRQGNLDYALVPYGELGNAHRFSFGLRF